MARARLRRPQPRQRSQWKNHQGSQTRRSWSGRGTTMRRPSREPRQALEMRVTTSLQFSTVWLYPKKKEATKEPPMNRRLILHHLSLWGTKAKKLVSDQAAGIIITPESRVLEDGTNDILNFWR
eukprot:9495424-Pyramimonas_sp.AAC.1